MTRRVQPLCRALAVTARALVGATDRPPRPRTTRSKPSISTAATSTGSAPGSGISASLVRSAPISTAANRPTSGWPTIAACPPAAVTAATMLNGSDRAPDNTATTPRGNPLGRTPAHDSGVGSKCSEGGSVAPEGIDPRGVEPPVPAAFPDTSAILRRRCSTCSARFCARSSTRITTATRAPCTPSDPFPHFESMFDTTSKHSPPDTVKRQAPMGESCTPAEKWLCVRSISGLEFGHRTHFGRGLMRAL